MSSCENIRGPGLGTALQIPNIPSLIPSSTPPGLTATQPVPLRPEPPPPLAIQPSSTRHSRSTEIVTNGLAKCNGSSIQTHSLSEGLLSHIHLSPQVHISHKDGLSISIPQFVCSESDSVATTSPYSTLLMAPSASLTPLSPNNRAENENSLHNPPRLDNSCFNNSRRSTPVTIKEGKRSTSESKEKLFIPTEIANNNYFKTSASPLLENCTEGDENACNGGDASPFKPLADSNESTSAKADCSKSSSLIKYPIPTKAGTLEMSANDSSAPDLPIPYVLSTSEDSVLSVSPLTSLNKLASQINENLTSTLEHSKPLALPPAHKSSLSSIQANSSSLTTATHSTSISAITNLNSSLKGVLDSVEPATMAKPHLANHVNNFLLKPVETTNACYIQVKRTSSVSVSPDSENKGELEEDKSGFVSLFLSEVGSQCSRTVPGLMRFYSRHKKTLSTSLSVSLSLSGQSTPPCSPISPGTLNLVVPPRGSIDSSSVISPDRSRRSLTPSLSSASDSSFRTRNLSGSSGSSASVSATRFRDEILRSPGQRTTDSGISLAPGTETTRLSRPGCALPSSFADCESSAQFRPLTHSKQTVSSTSNKSTARFVKNKSQVEKEASCTESSSISSCSPSLALASQWPLGLLSSPSPYWIHSSQFPGVGANANLPLGYPMTRDHVPAGLFGLPLPHPFTDPVTQRLLWAAAYASVSATPFLPPEQLLMESHLRSNVHPTPSKYSVHPGHPPNPRPDCDSPKKGVAPFPQNIPLVNFPPGHLEFPATPPPFYYPAQPNPFCLPSFPQPLSSAFNHSEMPPLIPIFTSASTTTTVTSTSKSNPTITSKEKGVPSSCSSMSNAWSPHISSVPIPSPTPQKQTEKRVNCKSEPPIDLSKKSNKATSASVGTESRKKCVSSTVPDLCIKQEIKREQPSPSISLRSENEQSYKESSLKPIINNHRTSNDDKWTIDLKSVKSEIEDNRFRKSNENLIGSCLNDENSISYPGFSDSNKRKQGCKKDSIDSSGLELLLQTFLLHGDRLAPESAAPPSDKSTKLSPSPSQNLMDNPSTRTPLLVKEATNDVVQPAGMDRADLSSASSSSLPQYASKQNGFSVLCALAEQRIMEEEQNQTYYSALSSLADLASTSPFVPTDAMAETILRSSGKRTKSTYSHPGRVRDAVAAVNKTDFNSNYKNSNSLSPNPVTLDLSFAKTAPNLAAKSSHNFVGFDRSSPLLVSRPESTSDPETDFDLIDSDSFCESRCSRLTPEPPSTDCAHSPAKRSVSSLSSFRSNFASNSELDANSQLESASDAESSVNCSRFQRRKPGRPRKRSPTNNDSETIVARNSKAALEFLMRNKSKIRPKLKAELKVKSYDSEDDRTENEALSGYESESGTKKMNLSRDNFRKRLVDIGKRESGSSTEARSQKQRGTGRASLTKKALLRDKQKRKSSFEKNSNMQELFRSLKRYSSFAAAEHDESDDEDAKAAGDEAPYRFNSYETAANLDRDVQGAYAAAKLNKRNKNKPSVRQTAPTAAPDPLPFAGNVIAPLSHSTDPQRAANAAFQAHSRESSVCSLAVQDLVSGARVLVLRDGLFYAGTLTPIDPPDVYGVHIDGERGSKQHIYCQEELLSQTFREVKPGSTRFLTEGTRMCAFWSPQYRGLYPGCVAGAASPRPEANPNLVNVEFDDGDSGRIHVDDIRLLPVDFPRVEYDPNPLMTLNKRKRRSIDVEPEKRSRDARDGANRPNGRNSETASESTLDRRNASPEIPKMRIKLDSPDGGKVELATVHSDLKDGSNTRPPLAGDPSGTSPEAPAQHKNKHKRKHRKRRSQDSAENYPRVEPGDNVLRMRIKTPPPAKHQPVDQALRNQSLYSLKQPTIVPSKTKKTNPAARDKRCPSEKSKMAPFLLERQLWRWSGKSYRRPGGKGKGKKQFYREIVRGKEHIRVGDCAVFLSSGSHERPFIGRIDFLWESWGGNMVVKVRWFYHPDETIGIEKTLAEPRGALFSSSHTDENDVQTISHKCRVLSLAEYRGERSQLDRKRGPDYDNYDLYYLAGFYDAYYARITMEPGVS